jgi:hypothetical protein
MDCNTSFLTIFSILAILVHAVQIHTIAYALPLPTNSTKDKSPVLPYILASKLLNITSPTKAQQVYVLTNTTLIFPQIAPVDTAKNDQLGLPSQIGSPLLPTSNWHRVKIISPAKGQEVPIGKDILISGISSTIGDATTIRTIPNTCKVYVTVNGVKPYQLANGIGPGGAADYSRWNFVLSPTYSSIKEGSHNKITAKYTYGVDPRATSFYSISVTGVPTTITPVDSPHLIGPSPTIKTTSKQQVAPMSTPGTSIVENSHRAALSSNSTQMNYLGLHDVGHGRVHRSSSLSLVQSDPSRCDINSGFNPYIFAFEP